MKARNNNTPIDKKRLLTVEEGAQYVSLGTKTAKKYFDEIGAAIKFGSRTVIDKNIVDAALDRLAKGESEK